MLLKAKDHRTPEVPYEQFSKILDRVDEIREMKSIESGKQVKLYKEDKKERFAPELLKFSTIVYEGPKNFLMDLDNRQDIYKIQEKDGLCTKMPYPLSEDAVELHLTGKKSIEVYQYNKENLIKWISFIINLDKEQDCNRLCEYLEYYNYPYRLEKSNTFNIFIRLKPISNKIAYEFGMSILNKVGINCEFLPKKTTVRKDENGQSIKLPLSLNSKIKVNNEFVRDFKNMELGIIDLSGCEQSTACY
jgi:hypothetical protein